MTKPTRSRSEIGRANLAKSKTAERAVAAYYRASGWPHAERTVRTGFDVAGRAVADCGDIDGTPGWITQVKHVARPGPADLRVWLAETDAQRQAAGADFGLLVVKRPRHAHPAAWWAHLRLVDLARLLEADPSGIDPQAAIQAELQAVLPLLRRAGYGSPVEEAA